MPCLGNGVTGIVLPEKEEKVLPIKKGDAIALPFGVIMWWYNKEDTDLVVLFLGDTSKAHKSGSFIDFFLTDSNGIFTGFSTSLWAELGIWNKILLRPSLKTKPAVALSSLIKL